MGHIWLSFGPDSGGRLALLLNFRYSSMCLQILIIFCYQLMAEERGLIVDVQGFNAALDEARERSRSAQNKVFDHLLYHLLS